jgi:HEAT repeat protein
MSLGSKLLAGTLIGLVLLNPSLIAHAKVIARPNAPKAPATPAPNQLYATSDGSNRVESAAALRALHDFSIVTLRGGLSEEDPFEQLFAAGALGVNGDAIGATLLEDAFYSPDPSLRMASVDGLADIGDAKAVAVLQRLFYRSSDDARRRLALGGLSQIKDCTVTAPLLEAAQGSDAGMRVEAAQALGQAGCKDAVLPLLVLFSSERDPLAKTVIGHALLLLGDNSTVAQLRILLEHSPDRDVRAVAALALGDARDRAMIKPLQRALASEDPEVKMAAAAALTHYSCRDGLEILKAAIANRDYLVRHWLSELLERLDFAVSREVLTASLDSADPGLQLAATKAIGLKGGAGEVTILMRQFRRASDPIVRADVAWALGRIARPDCIEPLLDMIAQPDAAVRYTAADALARTTSRLLIGSAN